MINYEKTKRYCCEDISLIENYEQAVADHMQVWDIHHRLEIQGPFTNSRELLIKCGMYYGVPASQLVFMTHAEHLRLHYKGRPGHLRSAETRLKLSEVHKGKSMSEEHKRKIAEALKGRRRHFSEEHRQKLSQAKKGKPKSEETRRKMSEARRGKRMSEETKRKISEACRKYW